MKMYEIVKVEAERHHRRDVIMLEVPKHSRAHPAMKQMILERRVANICSRAHVAILHQPDLILGLAPARFHLSGA